MPDQPASDEPAPDQSGFDDSGSGPPVAAEPVEGRDAAEQLRTYADALAGALDAAIPQWVERCVVELLGDAYGRATPEQQAEARAAGVAARDEVMPQLRTLLATDVDRQRANPLAIVRAAVRHPTEVLQRAGVPPVVRDEVAARLFPDDVYDLSPASFGEVGSAVHEPGLVWGAAKAHVVLSRRRAEGRR
ncbi:MAG TPA: hypothetical protein VHA73_01895 [Acidimicrobiales bacterium]|nr:hypothetical protein [Acidimicrobiales bacterium]